MHEISREQTIKFRWRSGSRIRICIRIATLIRRALAEVCTAPVLLLLKSSCRYFFSEYPVQLNKLLGKVSYVQIIVSYVTADLERHWCAVQEDRDTPLVRYSHVTQR